MGSCVSVHNDPDSGMKITLSLGSKAKSHLIPSLTKKTMNGERPSTTFCPDSGKLAEQLAFNDSPSPIEKRRDFGSQEEAFFDTQAWLESDCEDDFLSLNGEFTPSSCGTPNYQRSIYGTPQHDNAFFVETIPNEKRETSPTDKKKKLADLFKDNLRDEQDSVGQVVDNGKLEVNSIHVSIPRKSSDGIPHMSGTISLCSSVRTPTRDFRPEKEKKVNAAQCCLPSLVTSLSFSERKKHQSPAHHSSG